MAHVAHALPRRAHASLHRPARPKGRHRGGLADRQDRVRAQLPGLPHGPGPRHGPLRAAHDRGRQEVLPAARRADDSGLPEAPTQGPRRREGAAGRQDGAPEDLPRRHAHDDGLQRGVGARVDPRALHHRRREGPLGGLGGPRGRPVEARRGPADHLLQREGHRGLHADRQGRVQHRDGIRGRHPGALGHSVPRVRRVARHRLRPDPLRLRVRARQRPQGLPPQGRAHVVLSVVRLPLLRARHARGPEPMAGRQPGRAGVHAHPQLLAQRLLLAVDVVVQHLPRLPRGQGRPGTAAGRLQHPLRAPLGGPRRPRLRRRDDGAPRGLRRAPRRHARRAAGRRPRGHRRRRRPGHAPRVRGRGPRALGRDVGPREGRHSRPT